MKHRWLIHEAQTDVQLMDGDGVALCQQHGLLQHVAQLAHVARPAVAEQQFFGLVAEMQVRFAVTLAV
ncbi:hypothetical protein D3C84_1125660 [compost metagenome]